MAWTSKERVEQVESRRETATNIILSFPIASGVVSALLYFFSDPHLASWCLAVGGVGAGVVMDTIYGVVINVANNIWKITFWEHATWALSFTCVASFLNPPARLLLLAVGAYLFVNEWFQVHPFSYGEANFPATIVTLIVVGGITTYCWIF